MFCMRGLDSPTAWEPAWVRLCLQNDIGPRSGLDSPTAWEPAWVGKPVCVCRVI